MINKNDVEQENMLKEILLAPSTEAINDRFSTSEQLAAGCSGRCATGVCQTLV